MCTVGVIFQDFVLARQFDCFGLLPYGFFNFIYLARTLLSIESIQLNLSALTKFSLNLVGQRSSISVATWPNNELKSDVDLWLRSQKYDVDLWSRSQKSYVEFLCNPGQVFGPNEKKQ